MKLMPEQPTEEMLEAVRKAIENDYSIEALILDLYAAAPNTEPAIRTDNSAVIANMQKQIDELKRDKEMLVEALQFYTEDVVYDDDIIGLKVIKTGGKAREALEKVKELP